MAKKIEVKLKRKKKESDSSPSTEDLSRVPEKAKRNAAEDWMVRTNADKKNSGKVRVVRACDVHTPYILRRPTGVLGLDLELGGGFHAGGVIEVRGSESVGKTLLVFQTAGQTQRLYGDAARILIACTEILPDKGLARQAGFCLAYSEDEIAQYEALRAAEGIPPFSEEELEDLRFQTGTVGVIVADNGETLLQNIVDALDFSRDDPDQGWQLIIIESLGALLSSDAEQKEVGENIRIGGVSGMLTAFQNKVYPKLIFPRPDGRMQETTLVGINQVRANFDAGMYGPKTRAAAGSHSWKHAQLIALELSRGADIRVDRDTVIGKAIRWKIAKGKAGTHDGKSGEYNFFHFNKHDPVFWGDVVNATEVNGIDVITDAVETAKKLEVIEASGAWLSWREGKREILRAQGADKFASLLMDKPELLEDLKLQCGSHESPVYRM
jgi:RecA/RadA recombinase